ncbi:MAG: hypothetical protein EZS28_030190 [Streblomastix strix]|uniref:Uncharacterized protein n=1 Tax=Streblomastix strix TaxID=222440 RepID=A0A5J4UVI6_9EUKA|nr:MAG: hypothetical protein EZS28_030190 [Streblomastix strix]
MPYTKLTIQEITDLIHFYNSSVTLQETRGLLRSQFSQLLDSIGFKRPRNNYELVHNYIQEKVDYRHFINAFDYDYNNYSLVDDVIGIENIVDKQIDEEQQGIDENLYDIHEEKLMIHNESTNKMSTPTQTKDTKEIDLQQEDNKENTQSQSVSTISDEETAQATSLLKTSCEARRQIASNTAAEDCV